MTRDRHLQPANQTNPTDPNTDASGTPLAPSPLAAPTPHPGEWVEVGEIVGTFGVRGELKVRPLTDFPERFEMGATVYLGPERAPHTITSARIAPEQVVLGLSGIESMTEAQRLRGRRLAVPETDLMPLPADQFYLHDLIGLRVETTKGKSLGVIGDVISTGGQDLFVVRADSGREVMLPAVKEFVKGVDLQAGVVHVEPIPGLFDDQAESAG